jgi:hypothetical protein
LKRKLKSSCLKQKEQLSLPSQMGIGCVAQLNRASDYGSEGLRFESLRGHKCCFDENLNPVSH